MKKNRDTSIFAGTNSGTHIQLAAKKKSKDGLHKQIWISGHNDSLRPYRTVNEACTQEIY